MNKIINFLKHTKIITRILFVVWVLFSLAGAGFDATQYAYTFLVMAIFCLLPAFLIEYNCNPVLKRNQNNVVLRNSSVTSQKSWIATFLLCLFTGHLGAHRFYVGKIGTGVVWLCTMGCFGVGTIVDLITIAIGHFTDKDGNSIKNNTNNIVNTYDVVKQTFHTTPTSITKTTTDIKTELSQKKEKWVNGGKEKLQKWRESNGFSQQKKKERAEQLHKIVTAPFEELKKEQIKPFGETATLADFHQVQAAGYFRVIRESLELLNKTTNPATFFGRYETAIENTKRVIELMEQYDASDDAEELLESLIDEKESLVDEFVDRCYEKGILAKVRDEILQYRKHLTEDNISYMSGLLDDYLHSKSTNNQNRSVDVSHKKTDLYDSTENDFEILDRANPAWRYDKEIALKMVKKDGRALSGVSRQLKDDYDVVYTALSNGGSIYCASYRLQNEPSLIVLNAKNNINSEDELCCDYPDIVFCAKKDKELLEAYSQKFFDWDEFNLEMKLFYGDEYKSPIEAYNNMSVEELQVSLDECRKQLIQNCLTIYKKTRTKPYSYESIKRNKTLSKSVRYRFLRWNITSWEKVEKPATYIVDMLVNLNNQIRKRILDNSTGTGGSYPERFITALLKTLKVDFTREQVFPWSKDTELGTKRYDFYLSKYDAIIEVHGAQHYEGGFEYFGGNDLIKEQENDIAKEKLAKNNGIKNYIIINAMSSSFEFIKKSVLENEDFCSIFDIDKLHWTEVQQKISEMTLPLDVPLEYERIQYHELLIELFKEAIDEKKTSLSAPKETTQMKFFNSCRPTNNGLRPHEILLLEKVSTFGAGQTPKHIANKWKDAFHEDIEDKISLFVEKGLLRFGNISNSLDRITVPELKRCLLENGLSAIGNKNDIIDRIIANLSEKQLSESIQIRFYELTEQGKKEIDTISYLSSYQSISIKSKIRIVNAYPNVEIKSLFEDMFKYPSRYSQYLEEEDLLQLEQSKGGYYV